MEYNSIMSSEESMLADLGATESSSEPQSAATSANAKVQDTLKGSSPNDMAMLSDLNGEHDAMLADLNNNSSFMGRVKKGASDFIDSFKTNPKGNSTTGQAYGMSALGGIMNTIAAKGSDYIESEFPGAFSQEQYPQWFLDATPQQRRDYFNQQKAATINTYYSGIDPSNHPWASLAGSMTGGSFDTSLALMPIAKVADTALGGVLNTAKAGATYGATYGAASGLANKGEVDPAEVLVNSVAMSLGAAVIHGGALGIKELATRVASTGKPITPETILEEIPGATKDNAADLAVKVNDFAEQNADQIRDFELSDESHNELPPDVDGVNTNNYNDENIQSTAKDRPTPFDLTEEGRKERLKLQLAFEQYDVRTGRTLEGAQAQNAAKFKGQLQSMNQERLSQGEKLVPGYKAPYERDVQDFDLKSPEDAVQDADIDYQGSPKSLAREVPKTVVLGDKLVDTTEFTKVQKETEDTFTKAGYSPDDAYNMSLHSEKAAVEFAGHNYDDYRQAVESPSTAEIPVETQQAVLQQTTAKPESMAMMKDPTSMVSKAIKDKDFPLASSIGEQEHEPNLDPKADWDNPNPDQVKQAAKLLTRKRDLGRPRDALDRFSPEGKQANQLLDEFYRQKEQMRGGKQVDMRRNLKFKYKLTADDYYKVSRVCAKTLDPSLVEPRIQRAAQEATRIMNNEVRLAVEQGLFTKEEGEAILKEGQEKGYWPRVWDKDLLNTEAGREALIRDLTSVPMDLKTAEIAVRSLTGEKNVKKISSYLKTSADGTKTFLDPKLGKVLWNKALDISDANRSTHLEMMRAIPTELEHITQKYTINDAEAVLARYIDDSSERLAAAKVFGNKHEIAKDLFKTLWDQNPKAGKLWREIFLNAMRDPKADNIQSFINASDRLKSFSRVTRALQCLKLTLTAVKVLTQLVVNGIPYTAKFTGISPARRFINSMKLLTKGLDPTMRGTAAYDRVEAAGSLASTAMADVFSRINESNFSITGTKLWGPLDIINNPIKLFKWVGHTLVEDIKRVGAHCTGEACIMDLLKQRQKFQDLTDQGLANRVNPKQLEAIHQQLEELGISRDTSIGSLTVKDLEQGIARVQQYSEDLYNHIQRGANQFSKNINFTNQPNMLPLFAGSFWGKMLFQLHYFAYNQYHFVGDHVMLPAVKYLKGQPGGTLLPLALYMGVGTSVGMGYIKFQQFIQHLWSTNDAYKDKDESLLMQIIEANTQVGGFGILSDAAASATFGFSGVAKAVAGPSLTMDGEAIAAMGTTGVMAYQALSGKKGYTPTQLLHPTANFLVHQINFPGRATALENMQEGNKALQFKFDMKNNQVPSFKPAK